MSAGTVGDLDTGSRERVDYAAHRLVGSRCTVCEHATWPQRAVCAQCGSTEVEVFPLDQHGTVQSWTRVWTPLPGVPAPYLVGLVELSGVRVFGHLRDSDPDAFGHGVPVVLRTAEGAAPIYWFEREDDHGTV